MKDNTDRKKITFKAAVEQTPDIQPCYQKGLQALGAHSKKIDLADTSRCEGSVDIDGCTVAKYPQENRWDYAIAYKGQVYFVEVHSAETSEVTVVLTKLRWLKNWLNNAAPEIKKLTAKEHPFYWIQSKSFSIPKGSPQFRRVSQAGLKPVSKLSLR